jgi:hypothetical protein
MLVSDCQHRFRPTLSISTSNRNIGWGKRGISLTKSWWHILEFARDCRLLVYLYNNCDITFLTVFILTHPVNFSCERKPEHTDKTHDFRQTVDWLFSHDSVARLMEPTNSDVKGVCSDDCATKASTGSKLCCRFNWKKTFIENQRNLQDAEKL